MHDESTYKYELLTQEHSLKRTVGVPGVLGVLEEDYGPPVSAKLHRHTRVRQRSPRSDFILETGDVYGTLSRTLGHSSLDQLGTEDGL